jgi:hypothetical protein
VLKDESAKNDLIITITSLSLKDDIKLTNMFSECVEPDRVKVTSDTLLSLDGSVSLISKSDNTTSKILPFVIDKISGRTSFLLNTADHSVTVKLDGWPEIIVSVEESSQGGGPSHQETSACDALASAIRNCVTELNTGALLLSHRFPSAPKYSPNQRGKSVDNNAAAIKYLLLTVVKGKELGLQKGCNEAYCAIGKFANIFLQMLLFVFCIELDDPPQKFQTDVVRSGHDPVWNENFCFNIVPHSGGEVLFEVYDKVGARFLGCNIISVDEILEKNTKGKLETFKLKSRKMEDSDGYSGSIDVVVRFYKNVFTQRYKNVL